MTCRCQLLLLVRVRVSILNRDATVCLSFAPQTGRDLSQPHSTSAGSEAPFCRSVLSVHFIRQPRMSQKWLKLMLQTVRNSFQLAEKQRKVLSLAPH